MNPVRPTLLIVDDEKNTREGLARALRRNYHVFLADSGESALEFLAVQSVDVVLTDLRMPGMDGITLLKRVLARSPQPIVLLLTAYGNVETAVEAMKHGAHDFLTKPVNLDHLELVLQRALRSRRIEGEHAELKKQVETRPKVENMIGVSEAMESVLETLRQVAPTRATVLILGESGTGKELVAQALHTMSPRVKAPFVAVHCAALSENLLESELFGHEKGAYTGATERRKGRFELADGGTLFLDEIGEISPATQVKILRVLEEHKFERVGGQETIKVDVRLVAATNRDLQSMVAAGTFREDLFYRLNVVELRLPPLRERTGDIPLLVNHYLERLARENNRPVPAVTPEALEALCAYAWPGNIRELRNVMERMVVMTRGDKLGLRDVPASIRAGGTVPKPSPGEPATLSLDQAEKRMIQEALKLQEGNRTAAAKQLGISRRTLHRKLNEYGLH